MATVVKLNLRKQENSYRLTKIGFSTFMMNRENEDITAGLGWQMKDDRLSLNTALCSTLGKTAKSLGPVGRDCFQGEIPSEIVIWIISEKWSFLGDPLLHLPSFVNNSTDATGNYKKEISKSSARVGSLLVFFALTLAMHSIAIMTHSIHHFKVLELLD
ncbi:hypothetical protein Leryth_006585 [Lithospermum erythrorhizon]|nr:hypothetical protein Leryth_006585 [Lithospermum erythrorhizon]